VRYRPKYTYIVLLPRRASMQLHRRAPYWNVAGPYPTSPRTCTAKLVVPGPPKDGSWHMTDVELIHALVPHAVYRLGDFAVSVGSFAPKLTPVIVTEVTPPASAFVGV
jgi:hypothetical protein